MSEVPHVVMLGRVVQRLGRSATGCRAWESIRAELGITNTEVDGWLTAARHWRPPAEGLFDQPIPAATTPSVAGSATSRAAAAALAAGGGADRALDLVRGALEAAGPEGLTDLEGQVLTGLEGSTYRPRRVQLAQADPALAVDSGRTRPTPSGRQAVVWVAARWS